MNKYNAVENLSNKDIFKLYEDVVEFGIDNKLADRLFHMFVNCNDGYSNYIENYHGGCTRGYLTKEEYDCYSWHESFYRVCGNCSNYRGMIFLDCD